MSEAIITRRRGTRSPTTPPNASIATCATVHAAKLRPTAVALPPRSSTANATAIGARYVPMYEIARAAKRRRKLRSRSGLHDRMVTLYGSADKRRLLGPALQPAIGLPERHRAGRTTATSLAGVGELGAHVLDELLLARAAARRTPPSRRARAAARRGGAATSSATPKWMSASRSGSRRSISSIVCCHASTSNSGGGVGGMHEAAGLDAHAGRVAGVERAVAVEVADVVRRVARRREARRARARGRRRRARSPPAPARARPRACRTCRRRAGARCARAARARRGAARRSPTRAPAAPGARGRARRPRPRGRGGCG